MCECAGRLDEKKRRAQHGKRFIRNCRGILMKINSPLHYGKQFATRLEMLFEEGLGPWIALIGVEFMILAVIYLNASDT